VVGSTRLSTRWLGVAAVATPAECIRHRVNFQTACFDLNSRPIRNGAHLQMRFRRHLNLTHEINMQSAPVTLPLTRRAHKLYDDHFFVEINPALGSVGNDRFAVSRITSLHKPSSLSHPNPADSRCGNVARDYQIVDVPKHDGPGASLPGGALAFSLWHLAWRGHRFRTSLLTMSGLPHEAGGAATRLLVPANMQRPAGCKVNDSWPGVVGFEDPRLFVESGTHAAAAPSVGPAGSDSWGLGKNRTPGSVRAWVLCTYRGQLTLGPDIATAPKFARLTGGPRALWKRVMGSAPAPPPTECAHHVLVFPIDIAPKTSGDAGVVGRARVGRARALQYNARRAMEKNWIPFTHGGRLFVTYSLQPLHRVLEIEQVWCEVWRRGAAYG